MKRFFVCSVSFCFFLAAAVLADVTMRDIWQWGLVRKSDVQPLGLRLDLIEDGTNNWTAAFAWGPHFAAGYLLPADISGLATTQQVEAAAAALAVHTN
ncbi:MAG TPA: hypothetical protein PLB96_15760, partial [Syntrophales bacterium]|nr:hypothetical protein [Syntrophales bacterium]